MKKNRREFLKITSLAGIALAGTNLVLSCNSTTGKRMSQANLLGESNDVDLSIIGLYGPWVASQIKKQLPELSFRRQEWTNVETWSEIARKRLVERLSIPDLGGMPKVTVNKQYSYDGLHIEEISWQLPYGRPTEAILLKPMNAKEPLPGILAFHDHGLDKYNGKAKLVQTSDKRNPMIEAHQKEYYSGRGWANEIAKRGYVVLVSDAFTFASRRIKLEDIPNHMRDGLDYKDSGTP